MQSKLKQQMEKMTMQQNLLQVLKTSQNNSGDIPMEEASDVELWTQIHYGESDME